MVWDQSFLSQWRKWIDQSADAHVFFEPSVVCAWVETYERLKHIEPRFLIAKNSDNFVIFLPLVQVKENWKGAFQTSLLPVGYSEFDYHDPIVVGSPDISVIKSFWEAFFAEINSRWGRYLDIVAINGLRSNFVSYKFNSIQTDYAPFINLKGMHSIEQLLNSLSQSLRGDIRRQKKRLESLGEVKLHIFSNDETDDALHILPEILSEHSRRWPRSYKSQGYHERLVREALPAGFLHLSELLVGGLPVSRHLGFIHHKRFYWYMPVYNPEFAAYSPGKLHIYFCIEDAIRKRVAIFDLLRGAEYYKSAWTKEQTNLFILNWCSERFGSIIRNFLVHSLKPSILKLKRYTLFYSK